MNSLRIRGLSTEYTVEKEEKGLVGVVGSTANNKAKQGIIVLKQSQISRSRPSPTREDQDSS